MYDYDPSSGLISNARQQISPNCDDRPVGSRPSLIVVHGISLPPGEYGGPWIDQLFTNRLDCTAHPYFNELDGLRVSAHFLIRRDGELVQYVSTLGRAWHAGQSCHAGVTGCNDFSIGIELEGADDVPYKAVQYECLASLIAVLQAHIPGLAEGDIVGHSDIAPGRKTDPGPAFEWQRLDRLLTVARK